MHTILSGLFIFSALVILSFFAGRFSLKQEMENRTREMFLANEELQNLKIKIQTIQKTTPSPSPTPIPRSAGWNQKINSEIVIPSPTPTPSPFPTPTDWGKTTQIGEHTWTMKVQADSSIGSAQDIFNALNSYRQKHGPQTLSWDQKMADFAKSRASHFNSIKGLDDHAGFLEFTKDFSNVRNLGLTGIGENSAYGYQLSGVHLIEWAFAGDKPHDDNQLNPAWNKVGIGVNGLGVDVIFGY